MPDGKKSRGLGCFVTYWENLEVKALPECTLNKVEPPQKGITIGEKNPSVGGWGSRSASALQKGTRKKKFMTEL